MDKIESNVKITKLAECYAFPIPEWIVEQQSARMWNGVPHQVIKLLFEDVYLALHNHLMILPFIKDVDWVISEEYDHFFEKFGCPLNHLVIHIIDYPDNWAQVVNESVKSFPIGFYGDSSRSCDRPRKVTRINYDGGRMTSFELENGIIQKLGCDQHGYYYN